MTSLVGASVLLIAGSALALVFGWVTANESLIWTSIAASVASGVALALAYGRARAEGPPQGTPPNERRDPKGTGRVPGPRSAPAGVGESAEAASAGSEEEVESPPEEVTPVVEDAVVGVRHSKRFHKPTCRYAAAKNAESITKADALARGYHACAVCKP